MIYRAIYFSQQGAIMLNENLHTEYKREYSNNIKKTIIAFANTNGGKLYIGIDDNKKIIGVNNSDQIILKIGNTIRDSISPDITMFLSLETEVIENKNVIVITVQKGSAYPYYLKTKGIRPEGVYIRQGAASVPASEAMILKMIKENTGNDYEKTRSLNQDLSFNYLEQEFKNANLTIDSKKMKSLQLIGSDNLYTNLALLLSDQCKHSIKLAVFEGDDKQIFKDRYEFKGSLFKQLREVFETINRYNKTTAHFEGLKRIDENEYPIPAIREALLNCIIHRDYSYNASTIISIYNNRIEFLSIGGLVKGINKDDIMLGVSISRNKNLANIFYRLKYVEAYGTGIGKIIDSYKMIKNNLSPSIEISSNAFKIILPSITAKTLPTYKTTLSARELAVLDLINAKQEISRIDIEKNLSVSQSTAIKTLKNLITKNLIVKQGKGKNSYYILNNKVNKL